MKNEISQTLKISQIIASIMLFLGICLLVFMITVEGEPGALPLILILLSTIWLFVLRYKSKKITSNIK